MTSQPRGFTLIEAVFGLGLMATLACVSIPQVSAALEDLQAQVLKQREELTFYRGIVSPEDGIGGLRIQGFQVQSGGAPGAHIETDVHEVLTID